MPVSNRGRWKSGVYLIHNKVNGKVYVGSSATSVSSRLQVHKRMLGTGRHTRKHLQRAWDKYGEEAFSFTVHLECPPEDCLRLEQIFINQFKASNPKFGYNGNPMASSCLGYRHTDEARARMSAAHKNIKPPTAETRAKMSAAMLGKKMPPRSEEWLAKQRASHLGHTLSEETRAKLSAVQKGKVKSDEHRAKLSASQKGRKFSDEHRAKLVVAAKTRRLRRM